MIVMAMLGHVARPGDGAVGVGSVGVVVTHYQNGLQNR
jgi:hypothetical protein